MDDVLYVLEYLLRNTIHFSLTIHFQNCQHNTAGNNCEYCAPGYQGDARRGTQYDCQLIPAVPAGRSYSHYCSKVIN